jgi:hypothetical protein
LGNGTSGIFIWGAQLEAGAFATSYIPTAASQVTRAADSASMIGNNFARWYNVNEGTFYSEASTALIDGTRLVYRAADAAVSNYIDAYANTNANLYVVSGGAVQANLTSGAYSSGVFAKNAGAYKTNDFAVSLNGLTAATDNSGSVPSGLTALTFGDRAGGGRSLNGWLKRISYYPRRLANTELQGITS